MPQTGTPFFILALASSLLYATPRIPTNDSEVVQRGVSSIAPGTQSLKKDLEKDPENVDIATKLARKYMAEGRKTSDPRFYGYAEAALAPWWKMNRPPVSVQLLRAILKQTNHDFTDSIQDLTDVVMRDPGNVQARLTRASVLRVMGRYAEAMEDCQFLKRLRSLVLGDICVQQIKSLTGEAKPALIELRKLILLSSQQSPEVFSWAVGSAAEIAYRLGDAQQAEVLYKIGLQQNSDDIHLEAEYADLLIDNGRGEEVIRRFEKRTDVDAFLLRLVLAEKQVGTPNPKHREMLETRFAASKARGTAIHGREEAIFLYRIKGDAKAASRVALQNWQLQREPIDLRIALETASAVNADGKVKELRSWAEKNRLQAAFLK